MGQSRHDDSRRPPARHLARPVDVSSGVGATAAGELSTLVSAAFVVLFVALLLAPLALVPLAGDDASSEKRDLAPWPAPYTADGAPNLSYLSQAGDWLSDHFAFRSHLIDLDATVRERAFGTSATPNVVAGTDGWLFYAGTLGDYRRTNQLSDRAIDNIACNLALMEDYARSRGKGFVVAIAPNKATLYPDFLPYYQQPGEGETNLQRLTEVLRQRGVSYVDVASLLGGTGTTTYLRRDSHCNNEGARLAYDALLDALGRGHDDYAQALRDVELHVGDLDAMLHPLRAVGEEQEVIPEASRFSYANEATSVEDYTIETVSTAEGASGTLMAYRDSFGNALLPYLATAYQHATFSKMVPYNMANKAFAEADDVIVERAERHLSLFSSDPPYLPAPERAGVVVAAWQETVTSVSGIMNGPYVVLEGDVEPGFADDGTPIYVMLTLADGSVHTHEAFHVGPAANETADTADGADDATSAVMTDWGYRAYVPAQELAGADHVQVSVVVTHDGVLTGAHTQEVTIVEGKTDERT